jgi:hypothetical protein
MNIEQMKRRGFWVPYRKGGSQTTTTQNYSPAEAAQRAALYGEAQNIYNSTKADKLAAGYTGPRAVGPSDATLQGQQTMLAGAEQLQGMTPQMMQAFQSAISGPDMNDPQVQAMVAASRGQAMEALQRQALPGIRGAAQQGGGYGGSRQALIEGQAMGDTTTGIGNTTAQLLMQERTRGLAAQQAALQNAGAIQQNILMPGQVQSAVGQQQEAYAGDQEAYRAAVRDWEVNKDWQVLSPYANIVSGMGSSQTQTTVPGQRRNPLMGALGGAAMGASVGGPWGAAIGGGIGLLAS